MKLLTVVLAIFLAGCASAPKTVILSPNYTAGQVTRLNIPLQVKVEDNRISNFTIRVLQQEPALYLPDASLPNIVGNTLQQALQTNGVQITDVTNNQLILHINEFVAKITESLTEHQSHAQAKFSIEVIKGPKRFTKSYHANAQLKGPLKHEQAKVEGQLNNLTELLITRIVSDQELIQFLQGS
ncbi:hypothetical protein PA25_06750 [Pseudoalteromonas sp. A25]|uniref:YajG family lipoprotein n=1 Tax=Pseudoalteromonas sp. A25 TaxID=116092 RepID=UPI001260B06E|nr:YajG family lipoprotein [Pseudoalteromonas sp. A25]BBN80690.1 hypothetical protein PA25_06750 [Pseudoalteromonas sp. A25]